MSAVTVLPVAGTMSASSGYGVRYGVWYRVGIPGGVIPVPSTKGPNTLSGGSSQRSGPRNPCRGWSGWGTAAAHPGPAHPAPTPPGPGRSLQALPGAGWALHRLLANKGEIKVNIY